MSSRLAGMKFMQRGSGENSPTTSTPEPPAKKQRLSSGSSVRSHATPSEKAAAEQRKRADEAERETAVETKWHLSFNEPQTSTAQTPLRIVSAGYSSLDAAGRQEESDENEDHARPKFSGRRSFGKFNRKLEKQHTDLASSSDSSDSDEGDDDDGEDDPTGVKALIAQGKKEATDKARAERKAKKQAESAETARLSAQRRKKEVDLNRVTSISGGGGVGANPQANMTCHKCGTKGHIARDCSQRKASRMR